MSIAQASGETVAPAPTSRLVTYCTRCGTESLTANIGKDGVCVICLTADAVEPLKAEYQRLWAKRARYMKAGVNLRPVESQLATVARRLGDRVHARIGKPEFAIQILNAHLQDARDVVERGSESQIIIPKPGDMLAKHGGVARHLRGLVGA
jgi:hypothetical protein